MNDRRYSFPHPPEQQQFSTPQEEEASVNESEQPISGEDEESRTFSLTSDGDSSAPPASQEPLITSNTFLHVGGDRNSEQRTESHDILSQGTVGTLEPVEEEARQKCLAARQHLRNISVVDRWLEYQHFKLRFLRRKLYIIFGILGWLPVACAIMVLPLCLPFGWEVTMAHIGRCVLPVGVQWVVIPLGSFLISCWLVPKDGTINLLFFLPTYLETFVVGCHILTMAILLMEGSVADHSTILHRMVLILFVHLCLLIVVRVILIRTVYPLLRLAMVCFAAGAAVYSYVLGTIRASESRDTVPALISWKSWMGPTTVFALAWIVTGVYLFLLGLRGLKESSGGRALGWEHDFRLRFMASVSQPPFLLTRKTVRSLWGPSTDKAGIEEERPLLCSKESQLKLKSGVRCVEENGDVVILFPDEHQGSVRHISSDVSFAPVIHKRSSSRSMGFIGLEDPAALKVTRTHATLLLGLRQGYFVGVVGAFLLSIGSIAGGVYISRHMDAEYKGSVVPDFVEMSGHQSSLPMVWSSSHSFRSNDHGSLLEQYSVDLPSLEQAQQTGTPRLRDFHRRPRDSPGSRASLPSPVFVQFTPDDGGLGRAGSQPDASSHDQSAVRSVDETVPEEDATGSPLIAFPGAGKETALTQDLLATELIVGSTVIWWLWVSSYIMGLLLLTPSMLKCFGGWMEYVCFSFLSSSNRSTMEDLKYPDHNLLDEAYDMTRDERKNAKRFVRRCSKHAYKIFFYPHFGDCHKLSKRGDRPSTEASR